MDAAGSFESGSVTKFMVARPMKQTESPGIERMDCHTSERKDGEVERLIIRMKPIGKPNSLNAVIQGIPGSCSAR